MAKAISDWPDRDDVVRAVCTYLGEDWGGLLEKKAVEDVLDAAMGYGKFVHRDKLTGQQLLLQASLAREADQLTTIARMQAALEEAPYPSDIEQLIRHNTILTLMILGITDNEGSSVGADAYVPAREVEIFFDAWDEGDWIGKRQRLQEILGN